MEERRSYNNSLSLSLNPFSYGGKEAQIIRTCTTSHITKTIHHPIHQSIKEDERKVGAFSRLNLGGVESGGERLNSRHSQQTHTHTPKK
jgi:hypothetical protein